jgi:hypothetical protein
VVYQTNQARVEHVAGSPPGRGCRWVDGQWLWLRQRWQWQAGRWVLPPAACRYSAPALHWTVGGEAGAGGDVLYYRPGRWYSEAEARLCPDAPTCPGTEALDPTASPFPGP